MVLGRRDAVLFLETFQLRFRDRTERLVMRPGILPGMLVLKDGATRSLVEVVPERGGLITRFVVDGREVLYLDRATLADRQKNVRGGIPVLFPSPGKLENDRWARDGREGTFAQHGFARNVPWRVEGESTLVLDTNPLWPWPFELQHHVSLRGRTLRIDQRLTNRSESRMPFGIGFHPYFVVADKAGLRVDTRASRAWDNTTKREVDVGRIDFTAGEVDLHLIDHGRSDCSLLQGDHALVHIECSPEYQRWVIWTLPGREFVCLEPWTCAGNALNSGDGLLFLEPGETRELFVALTRVG
jgi:galactose mutarotase-like enzyme